MIRETEPPDTGVGIEQFHHPRAVCSGRRPSPLRESLMRGLSGTVLELGAGDGVKFRLYPSEVREIIAVEPDPGLCDTARQGYRDAVPVRVLSGSFDRLPLPDEAVDAVICSLALCSAPRLDAALREIRRVLRAGGRLRFYEHVRSVNPFTALTERLVSPLLTQSGGGCHPARDTVRSITAAGFQLDQVERFEVDRVAHVFGVARRQ
ncbi:class I SAM-dependent methyltransferase [Planotetraspora thailandica]|nr:class I SAM-dependent methyltransferase [Planotetraspora thailandica]